MRDHVATYLNDHLAGSVAGLNMLEQILSRVAGSVVEAPLAELKIDIEEDRDELQALMKRLDIDQSSVRKASAWIGQKMVDIKLRFDDPGGDSLVIFESLEALSLGIEGKRSLWEALSIAAEDEPKLLSTDYGHLIKRAEKQREIVERLRLAAAKKALSER